MTELALLWHMHQPMYLDPATGEAVLPWVRLHAARAYYDMARVLEQHPGARVHVNLVPALLDQLEAAASGRVRDRFLELSLRPAGDLTQPERETILRYFFQIDWDTQIRPLPRYWELLQLRGQDIAHVDVPRVAREATVQDMRDLQLLFNLAWTGFALREEEPALRALLEKGRGFDEDDKRLVAQVHAKAVAAVVPLYRKLQESGQVELTATPHYHPILPLLVDTDSAREGLPNNPLPPRLQLPDDAREQVRRARESHERRFGRPPTGMWPAEGSVSPAAAALFAEQRIAWIASDEGVLFRSLPEGAPRASLFRPYRFATEHGEIAMVFRDRGLSDLLGFTYQKQPADSAVGDFFGHVADIGAGQPGALVSVILDGENPWEHYPNGGREFLHRFYDALEKREREVTGVLLGQRLRERPPQDALPRLHAGSWIEANFRIWIGHQEDRTAWEALGAVRRQWAEARASGKDPAAVAQAYEHLLVAEGSDWFWWFGDDFFTESAAEFDGLFRDRLQAACRLLGVEPPAAIRSPISQLARRERAEEAGAPPEALVHPVLDGRPPAYGEWSGAGFLRAAPARGAMHQGSLPFAALHYGFDLDRLYLRLDPSSSAASAVRLELDGPGGPRRVQYAVREGAKLSGRLEPGGRSVGGGAFLDILELQVGFDELGVRAGDHLWLSVHALAGEVEVQRFPANGALELEVPGPDFERVHWKV
ncbi:MAG TPA: glycoside hydrolase family 57 protein [Myxococcales bacterium]|nr:glycoside hydrolase family 57 protein [Myxococcales bacterium]